MEKNYILGRGENLIRKISAPRVNPRKAHPYEVAEARDRLLPRFQKTASDLRNLPNGACPQEQSVACLVMHPAYLAKTYYPREFLQDTKLRVLGSRATTVTPRRVTTKRGPEQKTTAEYFISATRSEFSDLPTLLIQLDLESSVAERLRQFEDVHSVDIKSKLRNITEATDFPWLEIVLHASEDPSSDYIIEGFRTFLHDMSIQINLDKRLYVGGLCFLPLRAPKERIHQIAEFSFLRVIRGMPTLRPPQIVRISRPAKFLDDTALPTETPIDPSLRIAVFDGGIGKTLISRQYVQNWTFKNLGDSVPEYEEHGHMVTGALLFGPIDNLKSLPIPYGKIDNYRVIDTRTDPYDDQLFDVISRIEAAIIEREPEFVTLSIGPDMVIDDEPHVWTCKLDQLLSKGKILAAIAVGNDGEADRTENLHRVQVPSDCVNSMSIGACDSRGKSWQRAPYSSMGPGRSPGLIKPDLLAFGGSDTEPFQVLSQRKPKLVVPQMGTSFAGPFALRTALGVRAYFGKAMTPLVLKALLINRSQRNHQDQNEIGWGRIDEDIATLTTCLDNEAVIIYQGSLRPGNYWEAEIPWPDGPLSGKVQIIATFCYTCETDPEHPIHYTRSGLDVVFRPHSLKSKGGITVSKSLFGSLKPYATEQDLRNDAHKWETTMHGRTSMLASSIHNPILQIHYNARKGGSDTKNAETIPYALVITIQSTNSDDFYSKIANKYKSILEVLQPIRIPIHIK